MYGSSTGRTGPQSTLIFIATVGCLGLALFLIAATIVLALIPVFISNKSVSANSNAFRSKNIIMSIEVQENVANAGGRRRKRDVVSLDSAVGGSLDTDGNDNIKTKFLSILPSTKVSDVVISYCSLGYKASSTRKRRALSKRAKRDSNNPIVLVCEFYVTFVSDCLYQCQLNIGPTIQSTLYSISVSTFVFTDVVIYKNGAPFGTVQIIQFLTVVYVTQILPGSGSATPAVPAVTVTLATTSTASAVNETLTTIPEVEASTEVVPIIPPSSNVTNTLTTVSGATDVPDNGTIIPVALDLIHTRAKTSKAK